VGFSNGTILQPGKVGGFESVTGTQTVTSKRYPGSHFGFIVMKDGPFLEEGFKDYRYLINSVVKTCYFYMVFV
jgi:hypothetical protein